MKKNYPRNGFKHTGAYGIAALIFFCLGWLVDCRDRPSEKYAIHNRPSDSAMDTYMDSIVLNYGTEFDGVVVPRLPDNFAKMDTTVEIWELVNRDCRTDTIVSNHGKNRIILHHCTKKKWDSVIAVKFVDHMP